MVAIHEQYIRKARPSVDTIHDKYKIRKHRQYYLIDRFFVFRPKGDPQYTSAHRAQTDQRYFLRRFPEYLLVPFDKQLVQILEASAAASCLLSDLYRFFALSLDRSPGFLNLAHILRQ